MPPVPQQPAVPWADAVLDDSNSDVYTVELEGPVVDWAHRDAPEYYGPDGEPQQVTKPAYLRVTLRARSLEEAKHAAVATHPEANTLVATEIEGEFQVLPPKILSAKKDRDK